MKYLYLEIIVHEGEYEHLHKILHTTNCKEIKFAAEWYTAHYWDYGKIDKTFNVPLWWWNGEHAGELNFYKELTKEQFDNTNEIMGHTTIINKKKDKIIWVCEECGSEEVEQKAWIDVNSQVILDSCDEGIADSYWCRNCLEHEKLVTQNDYKET